MSLIGLRCAHCGTLYTPGQVQYVCPADGATLDAEYDYDSIRAHIEANGWLDVRGMWRYKPALPIHADAVEPPLLVGDTPLTPSEAAAQRLNVRRCWFKDDGRNPTGSLKDRASSFIVAKARTDGHSVVTTASTGNAAAALAGTAASVGLPVVIFVPANAPTAKITQLMVYGAHVLLVEGTYDDAFDLCLAASDEFGWYCRNTGYNPYTREGKKTVSYEIAEGLGVMPGAFRAPDVAMVSAGDGNIISGIHKGFTDLHALGLIERMPRIIGVQAHGSNALYTAWKTGKDPHMLTPIKADTIADSISAGLPRDSIKAVRAATETGGAFIEVTDDAILAAIPDLARLTGIFTEPASAATWAGALAASQQGLIGADDEVVLVLTGNGLKDIVTAQRSVSLPATIPPQLYAVEAAAQRFFGQGSVQ